MKQDERKSCYRGTEADRYCNQCPEVAGDIRDAIEIGEQSQYDGCEAIRQIADAPAGMSSGLMNRRVYLKDGPRPADPSIVNSTPETLLFSAAHG